MKTSDEVFNIIRSMNKNEKGYFKKLAALDGRPNSNYVRLFDAIDQMDDYDEQAIKTRFSGETFVKQLHVTKNYLHESLRFALVNYHHDNNTEVRLYHLLAQVEILLSRKLIDEAMALIDKAERLALENDKYSILLQLYLYRQRTYNFQTRSADEIEELQNSIHDAQRKMRLLSQLFHVSMVTHQVLRVTRYQPGAADVDKANTLIAAIDKHEIEMTGSYGLQLKYPEIRANHACFFSKNMQEAIRFSEAMLALADQNPVEKNRRMTNYLQTTSGLVEYYMVEGRYNDALLLIDKAGEELTVHKKRLDEAYYPYLLENFISLKLWILLRLRKWKDALAHLATYKNRYWEHESLITKRSLAIFCVYESELMLYTQQPSLALDSIKKCMDILGDNTDKELAHYARILEIAAHYDMGNTKLLRHLLLSLKRWCKKNELVAHDTKLFLKVIHTLTKQPPIRTATSRIFTVYRASFEKQSVQQHSMPLLESFFDIFYWIDLKLGKH